jgi:hypothetical protein
VCVPWHARRGPLKKDRDARPTIAIHEAYSSGPAECANFQCLILRFTQRKARQVIKRLVWWPEGAEPPTPVYTSKWIVPPKKQVPGCQPSTEDRQTSACALRYSTRTPNASVPPPLWTPPRPRSKRPSIAPFILSVSGTSEAASKGTVQGPMAEHGRSSDDDIKSTCGLCPGRK